MLHATVGVPSRLSQNPSARPEFRPKVTEKEENTELSKLSVLFIENYKIVLTFSITFFLIFFYPIFLN